MQLARRAAVNRPFQTQTIRTMATKAPDVELKADSATNASDKHKGSW